MRNSIHIIGGGLCQAEKNGLYLCDLDYGQDAKEFYSIIKNYKTTYRYSIHLHLSNICLSGGIRPETKRLVKKLETPGDVLLLVRKILSLKDTKGLCLFLNSPPKFCLNQIKSFLKDKKNFPLYQVCPHYLHNNQTDLSFGKESLRLHHNHEIKISTSKLKEHMADILFSQIENKKILQKPAFQNTNIVTEKGTAYYKYKDSLFTNSKNTFHLHIVSEIFKAFPSIKTCFFVPKSSYTNLIPNFPQISDIIYNFESVNFAKFIPIKMKKEEEVFGVEIKKYGCFLAVNDPFHEKLLSKIAHKTMR